MKLLALTLSLLLMGCIDPDFVAREKKKLAPVVPYPYQVFADSAHGNVCYVIGAGVSGIAMSCVPIHLPPAKKETP